MSALHVIWLLFKLIVDVVEVVVFLGLALGVLEIRYTARWRAARAAWKARR